MLTTWLLECQQQDWNIHKNDCRRLQAGTWIHFNTMLGTPPEGGTIVQIINQHDRDSGLVPMPRGRNHWQPSTNAPVTDSFLVKIQMATSDTSMLIHDRTRAFHVTLFPNNNVDNFRRLAAFARTGTQGSKTYLWAKQTGLRSLSICLDRVPPQDAFCW